MKSINRINGLVAANQTIQYYRQLSDDYYKRQNWNYRSQYFNFNRFGRIDSLTILGNYIFSAAEKEFCQIIESYNEAHDYHRDHRQANFDIEYNGYTLQFSVAVQQSMHGVTLCCQTNFKGVQDRYNDFAPLQYTGSHRIRSNSTFKELDIEAYFNANVLPAYLYPPGLFRNIQIVRNCNKKEALKWYKEYFGKDRDDYIDTDKAIARQIRKRLNVIVCDSFREQYLFRYLKTEPRHKKRVKLFKSPSAFELSDQYCSEYDTDGHEEDFISEVFNEFPKNAVFAA